MDHRQLGAVRLFIVGCINHPESSNSEMAGLGLLPPPRSRENRSVPEGDVQSRLMRGPAPRVTPCSSISGVTSHRSDVPGTFRGPKVMLTIGYPDLGVTLGSTYSPAEVAERMTTRVTSVQIMSQMIGHLSLRNQQLIGLAELP